MRFTARELIATLTGAFILGGAPAFADDTEIFFNRNSTGAAANILMILDTSGSMDDLVTSTEPYDPSKTYAANKCATSFDTRYYYYGTKIPSCASTSYINTAQFKCASMRNLGTSSSGYYTSSFIQWGSSSTSKKSGNGSNKVTTSTTTYAWSTTLSNTNTTGYVECKDDANVDGDGVDKTKLYPSTDTFSVIVTTDSKGNVTTTGSVSGGQLTGVWDAIKNYWAAGSGTAYSVYSANYLNYYYDSTQTSTKSKISIMQSAASSLLNSVGGVNVGLMRYNYGGSGGMVLWPVSSIAAGKTSMTNLINAWAPAGITPLSETLYESYLYYTGTGVNFGKNSTSATCTSWSTTNGQCNSVTSFSAPSVAAARSPATATGANYNSPATQSCQKNYIVYLTDGLPNEADKADSLISALPGVTCDKSVFSGAVGGLCTAGLAGYMYRNDLRTNVPGKQNVTSYFIGFGTDFASGGAPTAAFTYLNNAAIAGGGRAYTATSLTELTDAFTQIFSEVLKTNTTFSAPAVAVNAFNRTQTLNDLYFSVFSPEATYHWPGNVKKYEVVGGNVVDRNGASAVDASTGFFKDAAQSYWSASADGADVTLGGAASKIPGPASRTIYIYKGSNPTSPATMTRLSTSSVTTIDLNIGGPSDPGLADLVDWALGQDIQDENNDSSTTDTRHAMGDPIHTQPTVVIYGKTGTTDDTVVFTPTNDGYFHAVDGNSGVELWAFIPQEMLPHLKDLYADNTADKKRYGLDGAVSVLKYDINGDGTIDSTLGDRVILYFGTGRNSDTSVYYAVDVTDKLNPKFMWSIDASVLPGLGQSWAEPQITRVKISGAAQNTQKLTLVVSGGYDAVEDNYGYVKADTVGTHIYMVDAIYGTLLWAAGPASGTGINFVASRMDHAIPCAVTVIDLDSDGYADRMYVGDMAGQLWRFDVWNGAPVASLVTGGVLASLGNKDESTHPLASTRRFYSPPDVAAVVKLGSSPYLNIAIGSGYRGHPLDTTMDDVFYSIRDYSPFTKLTQVQYGSLTMVVDINSATGLNPVVRPVDITSSTAPVLPAGAAGWELQMNQHGGWVGEKILSGARTFDGQIFFPTYTPNTGGGATSACAGVGTGTNREYIVNIFDGSPAIDRNKDGQKTTDERSSDLAQGGIAPETAFLFLRSAEAGVSEVVALSGAETVTDKSFDQRRKTYWHDSNAN